MTYKELTAIDATPDQDLGLTIAYTLAANQLQTQATTPGEYLAGRVTQLLDDYASAHVTGVQNARITAAIFADAKTRQDVADLAKVDLAVTPPLDVKS